VCQTLRSVTARSRGAVAPWFRYTPCGATQPAKLPGPSGPNSVQKTRLEPSIRSFSGCVVNNTWSVLRGKVLTWSQCQCSTHERCPTRTGWCSLAVAIGCIQTELHVLLRKEVIQPHLPVRLPCYDLVLITDPTFDSSLLAVGPLASGVTDFHDLTGGVYKARERIHRSVADLRLLATPTS
jgi:hypothetical protein